MNDDPLGLTQEQRTAGLLDPQLLAKDFMRTLRDKLAAWNAIPDGTVIHCSGYLCRQDCNGHLIETLR